MPTSDSAARSSLRAPLTEAIVRHRNTWWGILIVIYALAYTGQWRVGRDGALYRGLAHSLATGKGYTFGEFGSRQVYPGLPVLLAGIEKIFGLAAWPGIILMLLLALACLVLTYKLVRLHFDEWIAITVTFFVGVNGWFLELANELLTDIPFLLGVLMSLYGWERLRMSASPRRGLGLPLVYLIAGLALAAVMRPTFLVLAMAWGLVCVWGLIAGPRRRFYAICLGAMILVWLGMALTDPRVRGFSPLEGGYERDAIARLSEASQVLRHNVPRLLGSELAYSFFGQKWVPGITELFCLTVIFAPLLLWRINPLWPLLVMLTVSATLLMTVVPRYYTMVLPLTALGWLLLTIEIARRVPHRWLEVALVAGIAAVVLPNFARCVKVISEQRAWGHNAEEPPRYGYVLEMGQEVARLVPPGEKVIAPAASIMSFVSGRECVTQKDILPAKKSAIHYPTHIAALNIKYAVFPSRLYKGTERIVRDLMDRGVIVPTERVAKQGDVVLARVEIRVPPAGTDWRKRPVTTAPMTARTTASGTTRPSKEVIAARQRKRAAERKAVALHKAQVQARVAKAEREQRLAAAERAAAKIRKARKARKAAATQATQPTTCAPPGAYFDVGGSAGQSVALRSDSICSWVNRREPWLIPWQRFDADFQFWREASTPSQNGQVRHWSGRVS